MYVDYEQLAVVTTSRPNAFMRRRQVEDEEDFGGAIVSFHNQIL
jgi:hypothetical protein